MLAAAVCSVRYVADDPVVQVAPPVRRDRSGIDAASLDIRNGSLTREEAMALLHHDGKRPASLDLFLANVGISEGEFMDIALSHAVSPWEPEPARIERGEPLHDMGEWDQRIALNIVPALRRSA